MVPRKHMNEMKEASVKDGKAMLLTDDVFRYRVDNNERAGQEMQEVEVSVMDVADHDDAQMTSSLRPQPSSQQQHLQDKEQPADNRRSLKSVRPVSVLSGSESMHSWKVIPSEPFPAAANTGSGVEEANWDWAGGSEGAGPGLMVVTSGDDGGEVKEVVLKEVIVEGSEKLDKATLAVQVDLEPPSSAVKL